MHRRVDGPREIEVAGPAEGILEVTLELEHIAQVIRTGEAEPAVCLGRHVVVTDLLPLRFGERSRHLISGQVVAREADGLAEDLAPLPENGVGALSDVVGGEAWTLLVAL